MIKERPIVVNSYEDIPDGLIGSRFYYITPEQYKKQGYTPVEDLPPYSPMSLMVPIGGSNQNIVGPNVSPTAASKRNKYGDVIPTVKVSTEKKTDKGHEQTIFGQRPSNLAIGVSMGSQAVSNVVQGIQSANLVGYNTDVDYWKQQGKWWFDKNADYAPSFEEYAPNMPSAERAVGGAEGAIGGGVVKGAATGAATGVLFGGAVGAGVGAGVGALVGAIEGFFSWQSAKEADQTNKENAVNEYKRQLKEWTYAINSRLNQKRAESEGGQQAFIAAAGQKTIQVKKEKATIAEQKRAAIIQSVMGVGSYKQAEREKRQARWAA